ncbi:MAG: LptE family protein [Candidatus Aminicenantes bacterium]|nr:MAG: LptE family protein [Candidatus Aminicenantes bacterium]
MKKVISLIFVCLLFLQCGYQLRGTGAFLPPHIKKMNIPVFKNNTRRFELDVKLTQAVIDEIVARGKLEITGNMESADAVLTGEIVNFRVHPIAFSGEATADRYNIVIVAKIILRDLVNQNVIFSNTNYVFQQEYEVPQGTDFQTVESEAIDKVAERFARNLVVTILEGF